MSNRTLASLPISFAALCACGSREAQPAAEQAFDAEPKNLYFGDLHNHNSIGQSRGSLERTFEITPTHLDFFTFTPQSQWPDMREIPEGRNTQFERGFQTVRDKWAKIRQLTAKVNKPGEFAAFLRLHLPPYGGHLFGL